MSLDLRMDLLNSVLGTNSDEFHIGLDLMNQLNRSTIPDLSPSLSVIMFKAASKFSFHVP
jgi:hypothetical protein